MLVRNGRLGTALAKHFVSRGFFESLFSSETLDPRVPKHNVVLMSRHGYTTHGRDIETAVYRAIYTKINAEAQTKAITLQRAFDQTAALSPMSAAMCQGCLKMNEGTQDKPWLLWKKEVETSPLYVNKG
jgi:ribulose-5-phosphate 4-epimerase/fuculose-1-phosphate aldolase